MCEIFGNGCDAEIQFGPNHLCHISLSFKGLFLRKKDFSSNFSFQKLQKHRSKMFSSDVPSVRDRQFHNAAWFNQSAESDCQTYSLWICSLQYQLPRILFTIIVQYYAKQLVETQEAVRNCIPSGFDASNTKFPGVRLVVTRERLQIFEKCDFFNYLKLLSFLLF